MIWIIVLVVIVVASAVLWTVKRMKVLKSKEELEKTIESVIDSFQDLKGRIKDSKLGDHEKGILVANIERNIAQLNQWKNSSLPNVTFWKNHTAPIKKEFDNLRENVAAELARYDELSIPDTLGS